MIEHMKLDDMQKFCSEVKNWLNDRYGAEEGRRLWEAVAKQYDTYLENLPDYGGKKNAHALAI